MNFKTTFLPSQEHLAHIKEWLIKVNENTGGGFLCNWDVIVKAFNEKRLIALTENDFAIGFLIYQKSELILNIVIAEIRPSHRRTGLGKLLLNESFEKFRNQGIMVSELFCSPASSEIIWLKLGFTNFPDSTQWNGKILMFKPLVDNIKPAISSKSKTDKVMLWNCRINLADRIKPIA